MPMLFWLPLIFMHAIFELATVNLLLPIRHGSDIFRRLDANPT